jgi:enamine deaminase RidA (YjgF/YER057c/UK114 family)
MTHIDEKLKVLGIALPAPVKPVANYVPWVISGKQVFVSGQLPMLDGKLIAGSDLSTQVQAARQCAINIIAHLRDACDGDWTRIKRIVKLTGFVACAPNFTDHPKVINGASDLMVEIFGDVGRHARAAVGVASLPLGASVEIEAIAELE